jgi:hypothetical protein
MDKYKVIIISWHILNMSKTFTEEEYLDLVTRLAEQQYGSLDDIVVGDAEWMPSEAPIKEKMFRAKNEGTIDLTKIKKDQIKDLLFKHNNIKIYDFLIRITFYHGEPGKDGANLTVDVSLYNEIHKTPLSGAPCKMTVPFSITKDNRFTKRPWLSYFVNSHGKNIPADTLVEIIRWMQVVKKLPAFL